MAHSIITLTTDFSLQDTYVGTMKGVIAQIAPDANVIDLTHGVAPQSIVQGALALESALGYFPEGTIHVAVVDPGVGSARRPVAAKIGNDYYFAPDNGLLSYVLAMRDLHQAVILDNPTYHTDLISSTFHGRDIFSPCAAHLAAGASLEQLGSPIEKLITLDLPEPSQADRDTLHIEVLYLDHFGNAITNLTRDRFVAFLDKRDPCSAAVAYDQNGRLHRIALCSTFADVEPGEPVAYFGSTHRLEVAVRNGSASEKLGIHTGSIVYVNLDAS